MLSYFVDEPFQIGFMKGQEGQESNRHPQDNREENIGKTVSEYRETYEFYSGEISAISRKIAFAGIGLVWVFTEGNASIPNPLILPSILLVCSLTLDMLQYLYGTIVWYCHFRKNEKKKLPENTKFIHSVRWNDASWVLWGLKILCVFVAYGIIIDYLVRALIH